MRSPLASRLAELVEEAARLEVPFEDCKVPLPAPKEQVVRAIEKLEDRVEAKKRKSRAPLSQSRLAPAR